MENSPPVDAESEQALVARFQSALKEWTQDENTRWRGRTLNAQAIVAIGGSSVLLRIAQGQVVECTSPVPLLCSSDFVVAGSAVAWSALWKPIPPPGWHDLFALTKRKEVRLEGDLQKVFAHLRFIQQLLTLPRPQA